MGGSVVVFTVSAFVHAVDISPHTNRIRLAMTSAEEDIDIGNRLSKSLLLGNENILPSSHPLTRIVQRIADRLFPNGVKIIIIISDSLHNAISLPKGDIILHAGLIGTVKSEDELAFWIPLLGDCRDREWIFV